MGDGSRFTLPCDNLGKGGKDMNEREITIQLINCFKYFEAMNRLLEQGFDLDKNSARTLIESIREMEEIIREERE